MDPAANPDTDPDFAFAIPDGAFEVEYDDPVDTDDGEVPEDPATAAAREARQALLLSQELRRPIDRAVSMATMSAWTLAVFAVISLPGVFSSFTGFFIVIGLGVCSFFEFRGRNALRDMNPAGATALARNQLVLGAVIVVYALANIVVTMSGAGRYDQAVEAVPELGQIMGGRNGLGALMTTLTLVYYAVVGLGGAVGQALMFCFHDRRRPLVEAFVADTPEWIQTPTHEKGPPNKVGRAA